MFSMSSSDDEDIEEYNSLKLSEDKQLSTDEFKQTINKYKKYNQEIIDNQIKKQEHENKDEKIITNFLNEHIDYHELNLKFNKKNILGLLSEIQHNLNINIKSNKLKKLKNIL
jgi:hypothetical protein